jgi:hypothetical protein
MTFGASLYGAIGYAGNAPSPSIVTAEVVLALRTNPPTPLGQPIPLGNDIVITATFLSEGEAVEPSTVTCELELPSASTEIISITRDGLGHWEAIVRLSLPGRWVYRIQAGGAVIAASEGVFWIANSTLA